MIFRFVANVDGAAFDEATRDLDASETLFIVASKTFTTLETMCNAATARFRPPKFTTEKRPEKVGVKVGRAHVEGRPHWGVRRWGWGPRAQTPLANFVSPAKKVLSAGFKL